MQNKSHNKYFLIALLVLGLVGVLGVSFSVYKEVKRKKEVQSVISELQKEAERLDRENSGLSEKISYLSSDDYKKREAKDKLNLQDKGEEVVVIKPSLTKKESTQENIDPINRDSVRNSSPDVEMPNPQKWWNYFFKY